MVEGSNRCRAVLRSSNNANANGGLVYANANNAFSNSNTNNGSRLANKNKYEVRFNRSSFLHTVRVVESSRARNPSHSIVRHRRKR